MAIKNHSTHLPMENKNWNADSLILAMKIFHQFTQMKTRHHKTTKTSQAHSAPRFPDLRRVADSVCKCIKTSQNLYTAIKFLDQPIKWQNMPYLISSPMGNRQPINKFNFCPVFLI